MGKKLIIKGADFAANGIPSGVLTFYNDYSDDVLHGNASMASTNYFFILSSELTRLGISGKTIRFVKLYASVAGTVNIGYYSGTTVAGSVGYQVTPGINIITLETPITLNSTHLIAFNGNNILTFWTDNNDAKGFKYNRPGGTASTYANYRLPFSLGSLEA